jgi:IS5 family transposase
MNKQTTFTDVEYAGRKRNSRRETFLETMDALIPWQEFISIIKPHYFDGKRGRPPRGIETMLRMYLLQIWFNLADEALEENIYDSYAMRKFMKLDFLSEDAPDATTLLQFRHLLEGHNLQKAIFNKMKALLEGQGKIMHGGTIVDATIIEAPSSTKNSAKSRDSQMKQTKKGNEWHFGCKAHIGVDAGTGMAHSLEVTGANVPDIEGAPRLIRPDDDVVNGDAGYVGIEKREAVVKDEQLSRIDFRITKRKGAGRKLENRLYRDPMNHLEYIAQPAWDRHIEYMQSKVRSKGEHTFYIIKRLFGYRKTVYRGLAKNAARLFMLLACANILRWSWSLRPIEQT